MNLLQGAGGRAREREMLALFAIPSLEEKLQTLAKGRGEGRGGEALDSLPPKRKKEKEENKEKEEKKNRAKKI